MTKKDVKINNERIGFSKKIKRLILMEIANGAKPKEAFAKYINEDISSFSKDKKYISKLIYKWKKEFNKTPEKMQILQHEIDNTLLEQEINTLKQSENDEDIDIKYILKSIPEIMDVVTNSPHLYDF